MSKRLKTIPRFGAEATERAFWESRDSASYVDWDKAKSAGFRKLKPSSALVSSRLASKSR
jgi:CopG antitoxin of type II toxin-antitoxin system